MGNIVFITNSISFGGAAKMLCFVATSLAKRGHKVHIVNLRTTANETDYERTLDEAVCYHLLEEKGRKAQIAGIKKIAKEANAQVLIGFTALPNFLAKIVGDMLHIPSIMSERGDPTRNIAPTFKAKLVCFLINCSKGGVFQTYGAMEYYSKGLQKRGVVIPNPIFVNGEVPDVDYENCEKSVVTVGRLDNEQKRYDIMIQAFKLFSEKHPEYVLKLYGRGVDEKQIEQWVSDAGLCDKVKFMGLTTQPMQDIACDGMFLITSDYEGISNSLLEAMAVGLPCVSTDHTPGGARLLITHGENGLLAPVADSEKLANAMCQFAENPDLAKKCGEKAKEVLTRFAPDRIIDMWEEYILKLIKK